MIEPAFIKDNPVMAGAFVAFMHWAWGNDDIHSAFQADTGRPALPQVRSPLDAMIDEATGVVSDYMAAFVEWVIKNHWGAAGDPALNEADDG